MSEERYVTVAEVKELLEAEVEARGGYDFMLASQKAALDHAQKTCSISKEQAQAIIDESLALDFVTDSVAVKIADILPENPEDVRAIFSKERVTLTPEQIESVLEIVRNHYRFPRGSLWKTTPISSIICRAAQPREDSPSASP